MLERGFSLYIRVMNRDILYLRIGIAMNHSCQHAKQSVCTGIGSVSGFLIIYIGFLKDNITHLGS